MASLLDHLVGVVKANLPSKQSFNSAGEALLHLPFNVASGVGDMIARPIQDIPSEVREAGDLITGDTRAAAQEMAQRQVTPSLLGTLLNRAHDAIHHDTAPAKTTTQKYVNAALSGGPGGVVGQAAEDYLPNTWWKPAAVEAASDIANIAIPEGLRAMRGAKLAAPEAPIAQDGLPGNGSVRPIDPKDLAAIMNDPEAAGGPPLARRANRDAIPSQLPENIDPSEFGFTQDEQPPVEAQASANAALAPQPEVQLPENIDPSEFGFTQDEQPAPAQQAAANDALAPNVEEPVVTGHPDDMEPLSAEQMRERSRQEAAGKVTYLPDAIAAQAEEALPPKVSKTPYQQGAEDRFDAVLKNMAAKYRLSPEAAFNYYDQLPNGHPFVKEFDNQIANTPVVPRDPNAYRVDGSTDQLTPAEAQEMDASAPKPDVADSMPEAKFVNRIDDTGPPAPANDLKEPSLVDKGKAFVKALMEDESGMLGGGYRGKDNETPQINPEDDLRNRIIEGIKEAQPRIVEQRIANRLDMREKYAQAQDLREKGVPVEKALGVFEGGSPRVEYAPLANRFTQEEADQVRQDIHDNPNLSFFDASDATKAWQSITGQREELPTQTELDALKKAYPEIKNSLPNPGNFLVQLLNAARSTKTIGDLGVPLRQAGMLIGTKEYWKALGGMLGNMASEDRFQAVMNGIRNRDNYPLMKEAGISFTDLDKDMASREEFAMSPIADKIPGVRVSERGFTGFLNQIRADTADRLLNSAKDLGVDVHDPRYLKWLGWYVNNVTGRGTFNGELGAKLEAAAPLLSTAFFSPRLQVARFNTLTAPLRPSFWSEAPRQVQVEYFKNLFKYTTFLGTVAAATHFLAGKGDVQTSSDPTSSDFGRIVTGNTHWDLSGDNQPIVRTAARLLMQSKNDLLSPSGTGKISPFEPTEAKILGQEARYKLSPVAGFILDLMSHQDAVGNPIHKSDFTQYPTVNLKNDSVSWNNADQNPLFKLYEPMVSNNVVDALREYGVHDWRPYTAGPAGALGVGVHTYAPHQPSTKGQSNDAWIKGTDNNQAWLKSDNQAWLKGKDQW